MIKNDEEKNYKQFVKTIYITNILSYNLYTKETTGGAYAGYRNSKDRNRMLYGT